MGLNNINTTGVMTQKINFQIGSGLKPRENTNQERQVQNNNYIQQNKTNTQFYSQNTNI